MSNASNKATNLLDSLKGKINIQIAAKNNSLTLYKQKTDDSQEAIKAKLKSLFGGAFLSKP